MVEALRGRTQYQGGAHVTPAGARRAAECQWKSARYVAQIVLVYSSIKPSQMRRITSPSLLPGSRLASGRLRAEFDFSSASALRQPERTSRSSLAEHGQV
ncbi:hypothetical protein MTO96_009787 [Rhipicephalus appendiculatus]